MRDFKRRVEFRRMLEHESKMALPPDECAPSLCAKCAAPLPKRKRGQGLARTWCDGCRKDRIRASGREYMRRRRLVESMQD